MKVARCLETLAAVGGVCAMTVTGCAPTNTVDPPASVATPVRGTALQAPLPMTAYELTASQVGQEQYLTQRLRQLCLRGFGIDYLPGLSTAIISQSVRITREFDSRLYGVSDPAAVRTYGYALPPWTRGSSEPSALKTLPSGVLAVLTGTIKNYNSRPVPQGGCLTKTSDQLRQAGISTATLGSGGSDPGTLVGGIKENAFARAQTDPRVHAVFTRWSACMRTHGYHYSTPFAAAGDLRWTAKGTPNPLQTRTAVQDLDCKLQVNLLGIEFAVVSDYQNADIKKNAKALADVRIRVDTEATGLRRLMTRYATTPAG
jgi:hypothetical protein